MTMGRQEKIKNKITKAGLEKGRLTEEDVDLIVAEYMRGTKQSFKGEAKAAVVTYFLKHKLDEETRKSFESMADGLLQRDQKKASRFRQRALEFLMLAYQNGTVDGAKTGTYFDLEKLAEDIKREKREG
jgi:hypothetical protein